MDAKPKILVVDDDRSICKLMGSILEMESYPFRVATSGEQARRAMDEEQFDILVSDIYLGDDSGLQLLERMKTVNADAEVVIMTAHGTMETAVHAVHNGAFHRHQLRRPHRNPARKRALRARTRFLHWSDRCPQRTARERRRRNRISRRDF